MSNWLCNTIESFLNTKSVITNNRIRITFLCYIKCILVLFTSMFSTIFLIWVFHHKEMSAMPLTAYFTVETVPVFHANIKRIIFIPFSHIKSFGALFQCTVLEYCSSVILTVMNISCRMHSALKIIRIFFHGNQYCV